MIDPKINQMNYQEVKNKVAVARALINEPSIILADEPSGNLDSNASNNLRIIFKFKKDFNYTFIIAHIINYLQNQTGF